MLSTPPPQVNISGDADSAILFKRMSVVFRFIFISIASTSLLYTGITFQNRNLNGWHRPAMYNAGAIIAESIPENTMALGFELPAIYSMLGWTPTVYTVDAADMQVDPEATQLLFETAKQADFIITEPSFLYYYSAKMEAEGFTLIKTIPGTNYSLYKTK